MKRGEIWTASARTDFAGKPRPALIVQEDVFADTASVTICPLTTHRLDASLIRPLVEPSAANGLHERSWAMADKITTVKRERLGERLGALAPKEMAPVNRAMMLFLGLAVTTRGGGARVTRPEARRRIP